MAAARPAASSSGKKPGSGESTAAWSSGTLATLDHDTGGPRRVVYRGEHSDGEPEERRTRHPVLLSGDRGRPVYVPYGTLGSSPVYPRHTFRESGERPGRRFPFGAGDRNRAGSVKSVSRIDHRLVQCCADKTPGIRYPHIDGQLEKTPFEALGLQAGELVEVRSKDEILATLDMWNRNRGLSFDEEMVRYCGGIYRVLRRVSRIVDEKTGKMMNMKCPCIILEGVWCRSDFHRFCPRAIYHYWRETWLKRAAVPDPPAAQTPKACETAEECHEHIC